MLFIELIRIFRLICRGTLEESTSRRSLQRRIYSELEANTDTPTIKKQTLEELFRPASDNGFFYSSDKKKKDKVNILGFSAFFSVIRTCL